MGRSTGVRPFRPVQSSAGYHTAGDAGGAIPGIRFALYRDASQGDSASAAPQLSTVGGTVWATGFMSASRYLNGTEVHAGDRVRYKGESGQIVFVSDGEGGEFLSGYKDYHGCDAGIMFCDDSGELTFVSELNENLELLRGKDQPSQFGLGA